MTKIQLYLLEYSLMHIQCLELKYSMFEIDYFSTSYVYLFLNLFYLRGLLFDVKGLAIEASASLSDIPTFALI